MLCRKALIAIITIHTPQIKEVPPFPPLFCLLSEPLLALFVLQRVEVPVAVNQKVL